jgi:hypothetical protein
MPYWAGHYCNAKASLSLFVVRDQSNQTNAHPTIHGEQFG